MNDANPNARKVRKPLPKARQLRNTFALYGIAGEGVPTTGYTCNPCIQTENDRCYYTKGICPTH